MTNTHRSRGPMLLLALGALSFALAAPRPAAAQGNLMFDTKGVSDKPQSKLWYNDDSWWACIDNMTKLSIYKLESNTWTPKLDLQNAVTPVLKGGTCDVLWDGTNLFVAAYDATTSKIYKLSYDSVNKTYSVLSGFPVSISMRLGSETIVIDKDSTGRLWVTFEAESKIYVLWSTSADHKSWVSTPLSIGEPVDPDDISTLVAFGGNRIGVAWSDQRGQKVSFRMHRDTDAPNVWQLVETVRSGFGVIDDHLNMKADTQGRIYLVAKDYFDAVWVARRDVTGAWSVTAGASGLDCGTRPILQIDEADNKLYVFYTRWETCVSTGNHAIEERVTYLDNLLFSLPTVVIARTGVVMNEVQGTKQVLPAGSMCILCEGSGKAYWTGWGPISGIGGSGPGGTIPPPPPPPTNLAGGVTSESPATRLCLYRMEDSGSTATDASGNGRSLSLAGGLSTPHWTTGVTGNGLYFDGDDYAGRSGSGFEFVGQSFTLEAWVKIDVTNAPGTGVIFARGDSLHSNYIFSLTGDLLRLEWSYDDTTSVSIKASGAVRDNAWHHLAGVWDNAAAQARLYVDGVQKVSKTMLPPTLAGSWNLNMGALVSGSVLDQTFVGTIDLAAIAGSAVYSSDFTPPILYPTSTTRYVRLTWSPSSSIAGIAGYKVQRAVNGAAPVDLLPSPTPNSWFADLSPLDGWLDYSVRSVDGLTQKGDPTTMRMTYESSPPTAPSAPTGLAWTSGTATFEGPAFWELDEGTGATAPDGTGLGHDMQLGAAAVGDAAEPIWVPGSSGRCLHFDGSNDYAQVADAGDLRFAASFTIEAWVRRDKLNAAQAILNKDAGTSKRNYGMTILSNGLVEFTWSRTSGSLRKTTSTLAISDLLWHHVACVYNSAAGTNTIFVDGAAAGTGTVTGTPYTGTEPILVGARTPGSLADFMQGDIDLLRLTPSVRYTGPFTPPLLYGGGRRRHVVKLTWNLPVSGLVQSYNVYRQPLPSGSSTKIASISVDTPWLTDAGVQMESAYRYSIKAVNSAKVEGSASTALDVTVPGPTDAPGEGPALVRRPRLQVEPNPFNPQAVVSFRVDVPGRVQLELYDARGRRLDTLVDGALPAGMHSVRLLRPESGVRLASGVYFVRLRAAGQDTRIKTVLVK